MAFDTARRYLIVTAVSFAMLYGATYQQFRYFDLAKPGGATDAIHYVQMARGVVPSDVELRHYRWLTPTLASLVGPLASRVAADPDTAITLAFYVVNFAFSLTACVALFAMLATLGFAPLVALLGVAAFATSRTTVLVTGTPMVDAAYFCAISVLAYLIVANRLRWLMIAMPLLVLSKETILPFLLLPLLTPLRRSPSFWISLTLSVAVYAASSYLSGLHYGTTALPVFSTAVDHIPSVAANLKMMVTAQGFHDLQSRFSVWLALAIGGAWLNRKYRYRAIPAPVIATIPVAFSLALLSGNLGRMFFAAFPAVIAYALVMVDHVTGDLVRRHAQSGTHARA